MPVRRIAYIILTGLYSLVFTPALSQKNNQLSSPNGAIVFTGSLIHQSLYYTIAFKGKTIVDNSLLTLQFEDGDLDDLRMKTPVFIDTTENYELVVGKTKQVHAHYKQMILPLEQMHSPFKKINFIVRAFDDGIAFRYEMLLQKEWLSYTLLDEKTTFQLTGNPVVHALFLPNYTSSHEGLYSTRPWSKMEQDTLMDMPALFEYPNGIYVAVTEAALLNYAGMYLMKQNGLLVSKLSPLPNQSTIKVKATLPHRTPWRVVLISDRVGQLVESNMLTSLNEPCKIKDVSWIKPGKTTFPWWNGNVVPDTLNAPGNNFVTARYYIDFCARNGIEYHSVVEYGLHQWYTDDGVSFMPGPHADVTTPVPGLDMKEICDYGNKLGVGIRVWVHWAALYPKLDKAFALFEKWGLKGMMVDFMDRDDQEMVNIQTEILEKAAAHHLHIQFHGAYKPTGLNRTYPNEFTREGTLNYEANKWNPEGISPDHDINMPFTRMLAGSTDYHLGGFRAVTKNNFKAQYTRPLMLGTRGHMLAMYVVLENYLQMVCDYPAAYEGQKGFDFIKEVPTTWDETKVIGAEAGHYICIARRKNKDWYIGAITDHKKRLITIPLSFLTEKSYAAEIYKDASDAGKNPNHIVIEKSVVAKGETLLITLASGGGTAIHLKSPD